MTFLRSLPKAAMLMGEYARQNVYTQNVEQKIERIANVVLDMTSDEPWQKDSAKLSEIELLFTSWDAPCLNARSLALLPSLRGVFHAAGSLRGIVTDAFWERNIPICSAAALNAIPVAEYVFAQIVLCLKQAHHLARLTREKRHYFSPSRLPASIGSYGAVIGLISFGQIARQLLVRLQTLDVKVLVYDPFLSEERARTLKIGRVDLPTLFSSSDVVSLHAPLLPETEGMITGDLLARLKPGAAFINTARGALVNESDLCSVLARRLDVQAVLDVTHPEPPAESSPLYSLPNVLLTPHIAGSIDRECARMGDAMAGEAARLLIGEPLQLQVSSEAYTSMA